jgi:hypothetical protein
LGEPRGAFSHLVTGKKAVESAISPSRLHFLNQTKRIELRLITLADSRKQQSLLFPAMVVVTEPGLRQRDFNLAEQQLYPATNQSLPFQNDVLYVKSAEEAVRLI